MTIQKIAIALLHGVGDERFYKPQFADIMIEKIKLRYANCGGDPNQLVFKPIVWGEAVQKRQDALWDQLIHAGYDLRTLKAREMTIDFIFKGFAYQPRENPFIHSIYEKIHEILDQGLKELAKIAGPNAPLCFIAHSLGSCIVPTYIKTKRTKYLLMIKNQEHTLLEELSPMEKLETLESFYSMGSPYPWMSVFEDEIVYVEGKETIIPYGLPIKINRWVNFYDKYDILSYPIGFMNSYYKSTVIDIPVEVGKILMKWTAVSHLGYFEDDMVCNPIADDFYAFVKNLPYKTLIDFEREQKKE
jgi:hypothetical protein